MTENEGDLISREALRKNMEFICMGIMAGTEPYNAPLTEIDNAPTVEPKRPKGECEKCPFKHTEKCDVCINRLRNMQSEHDRPQGRPIFNREELEQALNYWHEHLEVGNEEQNKVVWCAINAIKYCIEHSSDYQE